MRKAGTLAGTIDRVEFYGAELQSEIERLKKSNYMALDVFYSISNALDRQNLAMKSMKRLLINVRGNTNE